MKNNILILSAIGIALFTFACSDKDDNIICSKEYIILMLNAEYAWNNEPVTLDSFNVYTTSSHKNITIKQSDLKMAEMRKYGSYPIIDDRFVNNPEFRNKQTEVEFNGFLNGQQIISEKYIVGTDDCHACYYSGNLNIRLPLEGCVEKLLVSE